MRSEWNGKFSNLQIKESAHPELFAELNKLGHKDRSDRLRMLATIGLCTLNNMGHYPVSAGSDSASGPVGVADNDREKINDLRSSLSGMLLSSLNPAAN